jgi:hypothetical protein
MLFPVSALLLNKRIDCGDTWWITLIFGLALGLASAFLGGYATITGNIKLPLLGQEPMAVAAVGGIVFLAFGAGISYLVTSHGCGNPEWTISQLTNWDYSPDNHFLSFRFIQDRFRPENFVPASDEKNYYSYVGVRPQGPDARERGEYPVLIGPTDSDTNQTSQLSDDQIAKLGNCVELVLFGLKKSVDAKLTVPFRPEDHPEIQVFDSAGSCRN